MLNKTIIVLPTEQPEIHQDQTVDFALCSTIGGRAAQEDALLQISFTQETPLSLSPEDIAHRLWTSYHILNQNFANQHPQDTSGTTASTTIIKGNDIITATLADTIAFAAIWGERNAVLGVKRLTKNTHSPALPKEACRIRASGMDVNDHRVMKGKGSSSLAVSRVIGDKEYQLAVIADSDINITNITTLLTELNINLELVNKIQIITTCDGFTQGTDYLHEHAANSDYPLNSVRHHEAFLLECLKRLNKFSGDFNSSFFKEYEESYIAKRLIEKATKNARQYGLTNTDNISVSVQTIMRSGHTIDSMKIVGIYDGHGGKAASSYVVSNLPTVLTELLQLSNSEYNQHKYCVQKNQASFDRDNSPSANADKKSPEPIEIKTALPPSIKKDQEHEDYIYFMIRHVSPNILSFLIVGVFIATTIALIVGLCGVAGLPSAITVTGIGAGLTLASGCVGVAGLGFLMFKLAQQPSSHNTTQQISDHLVSI